MAFQPFSAIPQSQAVFAPTINAVAQKRALNPLFIASMINAESSGNPNAVGPRTRSGEQAKGLMQFMPGTYQEIANRYNIAGTEFDANSSIEAGAAYYTELRDQFGNDQDALMAYNWGPGNVRKWIEAGRDPARVPAETKLYVEKILGGAPSSLLASSDPGAVGKMAAAEAGRQAGGMIGQQLPPIPPGPEITGVPPAVPLNQPSPLEEGQAEQAAMRQAGGPQVNLGTEPDLTMQTAAGDLLNPGAIPEEQSAWDKLGAQWGTKAGSQALLDAGAALLAASGYSNRPISLGEALGGAVKAGSAGYRGAQEQEMQDRMVQAKIAEMEQANSSMAALRQQLGLPGGPQDASAQAPAGAMQTASAQGGGFYSTLSDTERSLMDAAIAQNTPTAIAKAQSDIIGARAEAKAAEEKLAGEKGQQLFERADKLRDDFSATTAFKDYNLVAPQYNQIQKLAGKVNPSGTDDLAMIYALAKILDPGSAVREGEVQFSQMAMPGAEKMIRDLKGFYSEKGMLNPTIRADIAANAAAIYGDRKQAFDATADRFGKLATKYGIDPEEVVIPELSGIELSAPAGETEPSAAPPTAQAPAGDQAAPAQAQQAASAEQIRNAPLGTLFYARDPQTGRLRQWKKTSATDAEPVEE